MVKRITLRVIDVRQNVSDSTLDDCVRTAVFYLKQIAVHESVEQEVVSDDSPTS